MPKALFISFKKRQDIQKLCLAFQFNTQQTVMNKILFSITLLLFTINDLKSQTGTLSGKITDSKTGETLIGVTVYIVGSNNGTTTDLDGNYNLTLTPGIYDIATSYLSYKKETKTAVEIKLNQVTALNFFLESEATEIKEVVIETKRVRNTDAAIISIQRKSYVIQDGISSEQLAKTGSSNVAESLKQMTGANIEDGKYMTMRGLGDRYSISQLNGLNMASTDPYKNSSSLDIIPSSMIDNIVTLKSFTPDMPGSFAGGLLNITTKSFPDKFNVSLSTSAGFNTQTTFKNFKTTPEKSTFQFLGFKGAEREMNNLIFEPGVLETMTKGAYLDARKVDGKFDNFRANFNKVSKSFKNGYVPKNKTAPINYNINFSLGNKFKLFKKDLGFFIAVNHNRDFQNYQNASINTYINLNQEALFPYQSLSENRSVENGQLGALANLAYKLSNNHTITFNVLYNNDAEISAREQSGGYTGQVSDTRAIFNVKSMEFIQRQTVSPQLFSKHIFPKLKNAELELAASHTASKQDEPGLRYFAYSTVIDSVYFDANGNPLETPLLDTVYSIQNSEYQYPFQFVRQLKDQQYQAKADFTLPIGKTGINKIKMGVYFSSLNRDFREYRFQSTPSPGLPLSSGFTTYNGNFDKFFSSENYGIIDTQFNASGEAIRYIPGYYYVNNTIPRNFYTGKQTVFAGYAMGIFNITKNLKVVGGLRTEYTLMQATSQDTSLPISNSKFLDFLPSLNFIYSINSKMNIRLSGSRTIVRPNLREIAPFEQFDTKNGFFLLGNPNLKRTSIWNVDLRWDFFPRSGELIAISYYYKHFSNPIFKQYNPGATIPELQFINIKNAFITGIEIEFRKSLNFISPQIKELSVSANFAYIYSRYNIPENEIASSSFVDSGYTAKTRPFQGQSPYIVNLILAYDNDKIGLKSALSFNISGKKLYNIALFATPDIYEDIRPMLNFKISKTFGKYFNVSFAAKNLINPYFSRIQTHRGENFYAEKYQVGRSFIIGFDFKF